jgi:hypothetical protein
MPVIDSAAPAPSSNVVKIEAAFPEKLNYTVQSSSLSP